MFPFDKSFNPNLLMMLENVNTPAVMQIKWTIDFEFDVAVRGLRATAQ